MNLSIGAMVTPQLALINRKKQFQHSATAELNHDAIEHFQIAIHYN